MTRFEHYQSGKLYGIRYWFDKDGDGIPEHAHDPVLAHNIIVLKGTVLFEAGLNHRVTLHAGEVFDFDWSRRHKITAITPASVLHVFLHGQPEGYDRLPPEELRGVLETIG